MVLHLPSSGLIHCFVEDGEDEVWVPVLSMPAPQEPPPAMGPGVGGVEWWAHTIYNICFVDHKPSLMTHFQILLLPCAARGLGRFPLETSAPALVFPGASWCTCWLTSATLQASLIPAFCPLPFVFMELVFFFFFKFTLASSPLPGIQFKMTQALLPNGAVKRT